MEFQKWIEFFLGAATFIICGGTLFHGFFFLFQKEMIWDSKRFSKEKNTHKFLDASQDKMIMNLLLVLGFFVQHSLMALPTWKKMWKQSPVAHLQRTIYVLATSLSLEVCNHSDITIFPAYHVILDETQYCSVEFISVSNSAIWSLYYWLDFHFLSVISD